MIAQNAQKHNELFESTITDAVACIYFKTAPLLFLSRIEERVKLLSYLDHLEAQPSVKVVILKSPNDSPDRTEYFRMLDSWGRSEVSTDAILRAHGALDQIMVSIAESKKLFISVESGKVLLPFFSLGFSCDYRIAADNLVVENPAPIAGLIPEGAGAFFLARLLGRSRALELILSCKDLSAYELLRLGLVDKVQPYNKLDSVALKIAVDFACKSATAISGVKKLVNHSLGGLREYLEFESEQLTDILHAIKSGGKKINR